MNHSRAFTSNKLEIYFLPDGGEKGKDEIPLHSSRTAMSLKSRADFAEATAGDDAARSYVETLKWWEIDLETLGIKRDMPSLVNAGSRGIITVLWGDQPYAKHVDAVIDQFRLSKPFDDLFNWKMSLQSLGPLFDGTYTCEQRYGRIQTDMADGTFLERELVHLIPLDQLIDNRYHGWAS